MQPEWSGAVLSPAKNRQNSSLERSLELQSNLVSAALDVSVVPQAEVVELELERMLGEVPVDPTTEFILDWRRTR